MRTARVGDAIIGLTLLVGSTGGAFGQDGVEVFVGALGGVSALSADAASAATGETFRISTYAPTNGAAAHVFAGAHVAEYLTLQAGYFWNRNALRFETGSGTEGFAAVTTRSAQHAVAGELLLYFRERQSRIRPYLSVGVGAVRLSSEATGATPTRGPVPDGTFTSLETVVPVAVGIDVVVAPRWRLRYSFSEAISANPLGARLRPSGERVLMNFRNLVGVWYRF